VPGIGDVSGQAMHLDAFAAQPLHRVGQLCRVAAGKQQPPALGAELPASSKPMPLDPPVKTMRLSATFTSRLPCWP
jgi:hypothetical protein